MFKVILISLGGGLRALNALVSLINYYVAHLGSNFPDFCFFEFCFVFLPPNYLHVELTLICCMCVDCCYININIVHSRFVYQGIFYYRVIF